MIEQHRGYERGRLDTVAASWPEQFARWYAEAVAEQAIVDADAVQLATADAAGRPAVRTVLARRVDAAGLVFYTNYDSAKGRDLAANPQAAAVFAWLPLERQVRFAGAVRRLDRAATEAYFAGRPRGSQLGAWASPQSRPLPSREALETLVAETEQRFADTVAVPVPEFWGGYLLVPDEVEFWQGRADRLHDRLRFRRADDGWVTERLAP